MRGAISAAIAAVAMLGGLALTAGAPAARASASGSMPTRHVVALEPDYRTGGVDWMTMEHRLNVTTGPAGWITAIRWFHWNGQSAAGKGRLWNSDVGTWFAGRVTFRLYRPREGVTISGHEHPYFTRLHISAGHGARYDAKATNWHWSWSQSCWQ